MYEDGYEKCFGMGCGYYKMPGQEGDPTYPLRPQFAISNAEDVPKSTGLLLGEYEALSKRHIPMETCRKYGYMKVKYKGDTAYAATYYDKHGKPVAQKVRMRGKKFTWVGNPAEAGLFGSQVWGKGKKIVITEGEIDALSVSTCQGDQWPVVSVPNGAGGAVNALKSNVRLRDIDGDGIVEIIAVTNNFTVRAFEHDGAEKWESDPLVLGGLAGVADYPAIADMDGDGFRLPATLPMLDGRLS